MSVERSLDPKSSIRTLIKLLIGLLIFGLLLICLAGPMLSWPRMDEANYLLQARNMAQGLYPYRDFFDFITPGGQLLAALWIRWNGFSIVGLRLWIILIWIFEILLVYQMGKGKLKQSWLAFLVFFLFLTDLRYPVFQHHAISGLMALLAVYCVWQSLQAWYLQGQRPRYWLILCGLFTGLTFWVTQSLGLLMLVALGGFSVLHCFLHEREEKNLTYAEVSNQQILKRWLGSWGLAWMLPAILIHVTGLCLLSQAGLLASFWRDAFGWLMGGYYSKTTVFGYFTTFHQEFLETIRPLLEGTSTPYAPFFWFRTPVAIHLFLIGVFPIIGLLGVGYLLPSRFLYRLLKREDEELLLLWCATFAMMLSTMSYSTSMHIVSNGAVGFLLAVWFLQNWMQKYPQQEKWFLRGTTLWAGLTLIAAVIGSGMILQWGTWLPRFPALNESLIYTLPNPNAQQCLAVAQLLQQAEEKQHRVFIYNESPPLY